MRGSRAPSKELRPCRPPGARHLLRNPASPPPINRTAKLSCQLPCLIPHREATAPFSRLTTSHPLSASSSRNPPHRAPRINSPDVGLFCLSLNSGIPGAVSLAYTSLNAEAIGSRAARMAGKRPPIRPSTAAVTIAVSNRAGVTAKAKVTWLKVWKFMVAAW